MIEDKKYETQYRFAFIDEATKKEIRRKLLKAIDQEKDQTYFLWTLKKEQLKKTLFPIGHLHKSEVRKIAKKNNLFTFEKKDSQEPHDKLWGLAWEVQSIKETHKRLLDEGVDITPIKEGIKEKIT